MVYDPEEVKLVAVLINDDGDGLVAAVTFVKEVISVRFTDVLSHVTQRLVLHWN